MGVGTWGLCFPRPFSFPHLRTLPKAKNSKTGTSIKLTLYDLKTDLAEIHDVADRNPEIVGRLKPLLPSVAPYRNKKRQTRQEKKS